MDKIEFISTAEGLEEIEECRPKPAKHFIPKWFKDTPQMVNNDITTVKLCPSFPDYFSQGYIMPMWTDTKITYDKKTNEWKWHSSHPGFSWSYHGNDQFVNHANPTFNGVEGNFIFKANCPWMTKTPPGWSVMQLPLFYHFNRKWSILPGIIDTDIYHELNQQFLYHTNDEEIFISRGEPIALYVPFKRSEKLDIEVRYQTEQDRKDLENIKMYRMTKYIPNGLYRKMQRDRDNPSS